jgi:serine/threonine protein kinase
MSCRSVNEYDRLNHIEEGSYGVVFRAREKRTGDVVALKKLKLEEEKSGFPITSLREVMALMVCRHENVVGVREIVVGDTLTQCVRRPFAASTRTRQEAGSQTPTDRPLPPYEQDLHRHGLH